MTWIDLYALVDHLTIVPTFMGIYYNTNWIGQYKSQRQLYNNKIIITIIIIIIVVVDIFLLSLPSFVKIRETNVKNKYAGTSRTHHSYS